MVAPTRPVARTRSLTDLLGRRKPAPGPADHHDAIRELRKAIKRAGKRRGEAQPVQAAGQPMVAEDYARWREAKLRRGTIMMTPEIERRHYALVLYAVDPTSADELTHHADGGLLGPPLVRSFRVELEPWLALAATLTDWLDRYSGPVALAAPMLHARGSWRVVDLGLEWELAAYHRRHRPEDPSTAAGPS